MNTKGIVIFGIIVVFLIALVVFFQTTTIKTSINSKEPIKFGWISPLSGDVAAIGNDARVSAQIAVDEINSEGGINGQQVQLIAEDGKCNPKDSAQAGAKLMNVDRVSVIMPMCSPEMLSLTKTANEKKVVLLSSCASAPKITDEGDYVFRTYPSDAFQGTFGAQYAYEKLNVRKVAILAIQNDWGVGLSETFKKKFKELGGSVVFDESFFPDVKDLRVQFSKIKEVQPDLIYFPSFTQSAIIGLKQAQDIGLTVPVLGGDAWDDTTIHKEQTAEGILYTMPKAQYHSDWSSKMKAKGANTTTCAPAAYDNVKILSGIIKKVGTDGEKIKNELYKIKNYNGVNGMITIDQNGDLATADYDVKEVKSSEAIIKQ